MTIKNTFIPNSELILNEDGSVFHLHLKPEQIASKIILVGDPERVTTIASFFDKQEMEITNREFHTITGTFKGKRLTTISTGIGCDNIDIVLNELDALINIDLSKRQIKEKQNSLEIVRIGTCGGIQPYTPEGTYIASVKSIGLDGLLNFYEGRDKICDLDMEHKFTAHMQWDNCHINRPYIVDSSLELTNRIANNDMIKGITVTCGGFYGPQGRKLRIPLADPCQNKKIGEFTYGGMHITNFEMESSALFGLSQLLGHKATTCCMVIANRLAQKATPNYQNSMEGLIKKVLERI